MSSEGCLFRVHAVKRDTISAPEPSQRRVWNRPGIPRGRLLPPAIIPHAWEVNTDYHTSAHAPEIRRPSPRPIGTFRASVWRDEAPIRRMDGRGVDAAAAPSAGAIAHPSFSRGRQSARTI